MTNILLFLAVTFWGLSFIGTKMALEYLSPTEIIAVRLLLGTPILAGVLRAKNLRFGFRKSDIAALIVASIVLGVHFVIQALGLIYTTATNTAWLIATIPVFIAAASYIFLKEKLNTRKITGIVIATAGVILLVSRGDPGNLDWLKSAGDWIILSSCITWTVYTIITRNMTRIYNPLTVSTALLLIPAAGLIILTLITTPLSKFYNLPPNIIIVLLILGIFCLGLAHWFWLEGLSKKGAAETGVFLYFEPIVTTVAAIPLLGEKLSVPAIIGAVLILSGVYLVEKNSSRHK